MQTRQTRTLTACLRLMLLGALAACAPAGARHGQTVLFASGADLQSINPLVTVHPLARQVQRYVLFTTLVRYDSAMKPEPYLARSWTWSPDRMMLTFMLRHDVRWHDGVPTTAADARWTLDAARDSATGYPRHAELRSLISVAAPDDTTLVLRFSEPQGSMPDVLTDLAILPVHLLGGTPHSRLRQSPFNEHPVGNGPFRFVAHDPNRRWVFARNNSFPAGLGGPPRLARFIVVVVDEPATKLAALTSGELDFAGIQPAHASFVRRNPDLAVVTYPLLFTYGIVLNVRHPPFDRLDVRRALSLALDRQEIVDGYLFGFGLPAAGPIPPEVPGAGAPPPAMHDVDSARALLHGQSVSFELLTVGSGEAALEQLVQAQLSKAGFQVHIRQMELSAFLDRVYGPGHEFDAAVLGIPGDLGLGYLGPLLALSGVAPGASAAEDQARFSRLSPVAFLYHARGLQGMNRRVHGVHMDLRGELATISRWTVQ